MNSHLLERQKSKQFVLVFFKVKITKIALFHFPALYCIYMYFIFLHCITFK